MSIDKLNITWKYLSATAVASLLLVASAAATPLFYPEVRNCSERNCRAIVLGGTVLGYLNSAVPWVAQVYAGPQECLRLEVTSQDTDLEMRVIAPDASRSWVGDDSGLGPCPLCPLVTIDTRRHNGWFTVHIGEFGGQSVLANFTLAYGRYRRDNPNCTTFIPTDDGVSAAGAADKSSDSPAPDPRFAPGR